MYRYTLEQREFIVRTYWKTESIKPCHVNSKSWRSLEADIRRTSPAFGPCRRKWKPRGLYWTGIQEVVQQRQRERSKM